MKNETEVNYKEMLEESEENFDSSIDDSFDEISTSEEQEMFSKKNNKQDIESEEDVWADSEEGEDELRKEYKLLNNQVWKFEKKPEIKEIVLKKPKFIYQKKILAVENRIKLVKTYKKRNNEFITVIISTKNDIFIYDGTLETEKTYNAVNLHFGVHDFSFLNETTIVLINNHIGMLKELNLETLEVRDIKKRMRIGASKIIIDDFIFVIFDTLQILDPLNYEEIKIFKGEATDFCLTEEFIIILGKDKSISVYTRENFSFITKKKFEEKFFFEAIFSDKKNVFVAMKNSLLILNMDLEIKKTIFDFQVTSFDFSSNFLAFRGDDKNQTRVVLRKNMKVISTFPASNNLIPHTQNVFFIDDNLYFSHGRFLSRVKFWFS